MMDFYSETEHKARKNTSANCARKQFDRENVISEKQGNSAELFMPRS